MIIPIEVSRSQPESPGEAPGSAWGACAEDGAGVCHALVWWEYTCTCTYAHTHAHTCTHMLPGSLTSREHS